MYSWFHTKPRKIEGISFDLNCSTWLGDSASWLRFVGKIFLKYFGNWWGSVVYDSINLDTFDEQVFCMKCGFIYPKPTGKIFDCLSCSTSLSTSPRIFFLLSRNIGKGFTIRFKYFGQNDDFLLSVLSNEFPFSCKV